MSLQFATVRSNFGVLHTVAAVVETFFDSLGSLTALITPVVALARGACSMNTPSMGFDQPLPASLFAAKTASGHARYKTQVRRATESAMLSIADRRGSALLQRWNYQVGLVRVLWTGYLTSIYIIAGTNQPTCFESPI